MRIYSKYLAMQIKAIEVGLIDPALPADLRKAPAGRAEAQGRALQHA